MNERTQRGPLFEPQRPQPQPAPKLAEAAPDFWADAPIIYAYTRAMALADGALVDADALAKEAGFTFPVALTHAAWHDYIEPDPRDMGLGQSTDGRLWDTLQLLRRAIKAAPVGQDTVRFRVLYILAGVRRLVELKAVCGPGDNAEPVITIMLPEED